ncbi:hypothetical protein EW146_g2866 [Bondarzewia mesenterica]|uniref:Uncharacterized protein n=1 Tax=Bondarzewia mesenterica TaxID=1095465 RepID=A0A4V3XFM4_9AGAM|nr:hypothetical protein EW146_g2866 [Bondarzewia mesenterica]
MPVNRVAENVLGTMGTVCWSGQMIPQLWKSWRTKSTEGLSHWLVLTWSLSSIPLAIYSIVQNLNIPLILQPQLFGFLSLLSWGQCMHYGGGHSTRKCILMIIAILIVNAAMQVGFVYAVRPPYERGEESGRRGVQFFGIFSSVMLSLALLYFYFRFTLPRLHVQLNYLEIHKHRAVIGISITFMSIDLLGGIFSDLSLVFKPKFDVIAGVAYSLVIVLDGLVLLAAAILNPRARKRAQAAAAAEMNPIDTPADDTTSVTMTERALRTGRAAALRDDGVLTMASADVEKAIIQPKLKQDDERERKQD